MTTKTSTRSIFKHAEATSSHSNSGQKVRTGLSASLLLSAALTSTSALAEKAPESVTQLVPSLSAWGSDATLIEAVKSQNAKGLTLDAIQARDTSWRAVDGLDDEMKAMLASPAAKRMLEMENSQPYFFELFLMDNQGANVAMTNKTSDYWQGDEAKWQQSFNGGQGTPHIGDVEFDESAQAYLVQVSVPVMDGEQTIGAITIGINIDELEAQ